MRAEWRAVEPDLACSGALSLITSGFVWHCPFVDTVRFSCLLGCCRQTGTAVTCPAQCHWMTRCQAITCVPHQNSSPPPEWRGFCIVVAEHQYVSYLHCLARKSLWHHYKYLPRFLMWKSFYLFPGCAAGALALSCWWGSLLCLFFFRLIPRRGHLGTGNKIPLPVMKSAAGSNRQSYGVRQRGKFGELPDPTHHRGTLTLTTWQRNAPQLLF